MPSAKNAIRVRPVDKIIGQNVIPHRGRLNLSQEELGALAKMTQPAVLNYENGKTRFTILMLMRFAKALDISWRELLKGLPDTDDVPPAWFD